MNSYPDHNSSIRRLNRLSGQLTGIKKMIEERRYCPDIIMQLRSISAATKSLEAEILQRHLESCVKKCFDNNNNQQQQQKIDELIELFKKN